MEGVGRREAERENEEKRGRGRGGKRDSHFFQDLGLEDFVPSGTL
jgi:hypothetical protein